MDNYQVIFYHLDDKNGEKRVCQFTCEAFAEMIKFLHYCQKYEVEFYVRQDDEKIDDEDKDDFGMPKCVDGFNVNYGSDDCLQTIDVWLK